MKQFGEKVQLIATGNLNHLQTAYSALQKNQGFL